MKTHTRRILAAIVALLMTAGASTAHAQTQGFNPNANFMLGSDLFSSGQSDNLGPAVNQILSDYWVTGACPDGTSYQYCDDLRMGMTIHPDADCSSPGSSCTDYVNELVDTQEDGGGLVEDNLQNMQSGQLSGTYNSNPDFRPLDDAMLDYQQKTFEGTQSATDSPWDRPNLNLVVIADLPQTDSWSTVAEGQSGAWGDRVKNSILNACKLLNGDDGTNGAGTYPSMPTWAMVARQYSDPATPFAGLVSAAGGTGSCCYDSDVSDSQSCDPVADAIEDVCAHVGSRTEAVLRSEINDGKYVCGAGNGFVQVGQMDYGTLDTPQGIKKQISCHLAGRYNSGGDQCEADSSLQNTDLLGKMSCVRKRPDDVDPNLARFYHCDANDNCVRLTICDDDIDNDGVANADDPCPYDAGIDSAANCSTDKTAAECTGVEWVDPNRSLYVVTELDEAGKVQCRRSDTVVSQCPREGDSCTVDTRIDGSTAYGRCTQGAIWCDPWGNEFCGQLYNPMPEICNGLDDDCDDEVDNLSTSWDNFSGYDPTELGDYDEGGVNREAIHCNERDVCTCSGGSFEHAGPGFKEHVENWTPGICECGESLEEGAAAYTPASPGQPSGSQAACSASSPGRSAAPFGLLGLPLLGLAVWWRRRR